ncbi:hypothetical protein B0H15DRAFT_489328 [Mycena belliarum]|uniref:Uncharacterized protein n=1 Tax=Mycena belliarum TaxID=1033014 RepID=A0AAD6TUM9_9AGAR|nr:hypothetical protein B0H15DRAFT_489328 [Mycena belliae]
MVLPWIAVSRRPIDADRRRCTLALAGLLTCRSKSSSWTPPQLALVLSHAQTPHSPFAPPTLHSAAACTQPQHRPHTHAAARARAPCVCPKVTRRGVSSPSPLLSFTRSPRRPASGSHDEPSPTPTALPARGCLCNCTGASNQVARGRCYRAPLRCARPPRASPPSRL